MPPRKQAPAPVVPLKTEAPNIPLHCLLCPKKPKFSDVSHLLTHVSSKSHLSNRFKAEIRSHKDRGLRDALEQFETWWERYNIRELLCDRMDAKDSKRAPKRGRGQSPDSKSRTYNKKEMPIKPDVERLSRQTTNGSLHAHSTRQDYGADDSPHRTPLTRRSQRLAAKGISGRDVKSEPYADYDDEVEEPNDTFPEEEHVQVAAVDGPADWSSDKSKLKGVFWPGMSLFDSATEEQKRKRNQRKDAAVLRNMEQVAAEVEPTECIWTEGIDLQRTRDIYATPSVFGSPEPEEVAEPKKKRARRCTGAAKSAATRKKRASTTAVQTRKAVKVEEDDNDSVLTSEVRDESLETTPDDDLGSDDKVAFSSSTNSPNDAYDIFRDPPAAGSGQSDATLQQYQFYPYQPHDPFYLYDPYDPQSSSPALTWASGHTGASMNTLNLEQAARPALQPLSSNIAMNLEPANTWKYLPHLRRGRSEMTSPASFFSQPPNNNQGNFNNPLALNHSRSQLSYTNQFIGNVMFDQDDQKQQGFQPINMNGMHFSPYPIPTGGNSYYTAPAPKDEGGDYEV